MQYGDYEIVRYTPNYQDALLELLSNLWGPDTQSNSAYLKWKYDQNPYADRPWIYLALYEGQPVGVRGNLAMRWQVGNPAQQVDCLCDADAVVVPDHRRKGLLQALTLRNLQDMESTSFRYVVTLSANASSAASNIKLGWQPVASIQPLVRFRPTPEIPERKLRTLLCKVPLAHKAYTTLRNVFRTPATSTHSSSETISSFDVMDGHKHRQKGKFAHLSVEDIPRSTQMADLVAQLPADGRMRHVRDVEFHNWRYLNPRSKYRFLFWGQEPLEGYLILQTSARPGRHPVTIVDWEARNAEAKAKLLESAIQWGDFDVLSTWGISLAAPTVELLRQSGFVSQTESQEGLTYQPEILLRPAAAHPEETDWQVGSKDLRDLGNWDFRPIYSDSF